VTLPGPAGTLTTVIALTNVPSGNYIVAASATAATTSTTGLAITCFTDINGTEDSTALTNSDHQDGTIAINTGGNIATTPGTINLICSNNTNNSAIIYSGASITAIPVSSLNP